MYSQKQEKEQLTTFFTDWINTQNEKPKIFVFTGAGISAESGINTYRDKNGLWEKYNPEEVVSASGIKQNIQKHQQFIDELRQSIKEKQPNAAHYALTELEQFVGYENFILITQNVDDLHEKAGNKNVFHFHGRLNVTKCMRCGINSQHETLYNITCPHCQSTKLRADIVAFGEPTPLFDQLPFFLEDADIFISIGTSGEVYPAAHLIDFASEIKKRKALRMIEVNKTITQHSSEFDDYFLGKATEQLPMLIRQIKSLYS